MIWPFKRKQWEKLGRTATATGLKSFLGQQAEVGEIWLRDTDYKVIPLKDFQELMWNCRPQPLEDYRVGIFDCDDFAVTFEADMRREWAKRSRGGAALAFGYIEAHTPAGVRHAFIWQLDDDLKLNLIEPQTDRLLDWKPQLIFLMEG